MIDRKRRTKGSRITNTNLGRITKATLEEFLGECADAIQWAAVDREHRAAHYARISQLVRSRDLQPRVVSLLRAAQATMRAASGASVMDLVMSDRQQDFALVNELRSLALPADAYVYHGTVFGRLRSIAELGLIPALKPVWKTSRYVGAHVEEQCQGAVFFTSAWRTAVQWAEAAYSRSRGRRASLARSPAVIRVPTPALTIELDRVARVPGCVLVRGVVSVANADVFLAPLVGVPTWRSLFDVTRPERP